MSLLNFVRGRLRSVAIASFATAAFTVVAQAGECPADKLKPNARELVKFEPVGVSDTTLGSIDLGKGGCAQGWRELRFRKMVIQPGGIVPWHSHDDRPAGESMSPKVRSWNSPATARAQSSTRPARFAPKKKAPPIGGRTSATSRWCCSSATRARSAKDHDM